MPARPDAPPDESEYTLSVDDVVERYVHAGHPRTVRRIQKYCARGDLDCRKIETSFGERYLITPASVDRHIAQIVDALAASGRAPARPDAPSNVAEERSTIASPEGAPPNAPARPDASLDRYVVHLEEENKFLRQLNSELLERDKETNFLIRGLQTMLAPLLTAPGERREAPTAVYDRNPRQYGRKPVKGDKGPSTLTQGL